ncbi:MAG: SOS response-associated peptidase family protein, partial [Myxococcaceae bacterium]
MCSQVPIIASDRPRRLSVARWGLVPARAKDARLGDRLVNARLEDLARRPTFQSGETRRCVVLFGPASSSPRPQPAPRQRCTTGCR